MQHIRSIAGAALAVLVAGSAPVLAHTGVPGHEHGGLMAGLAHPVSGLDHLLAMLAVGIWSALIARDTSRVGGTSRVWLAPAAFVTFMLIGAGAGIAGLGLPLVETGIALSVVALGLLIAARADLPALASAGLVGLFAVYHGYAHGAEASGSIAPYMLGFALTTAALHLTGIGLGLGLARLRWAAPVAGGLIACTGAWLLAG